MQPFTVPKELLITPPQTLGVSNCYFTAVNDAGTAVGTVYFHALTTHAFTDHEAEVRNYIENNKERMRAIVWKAGKFTVLDGPLPAKDLTHGVSVNNRGQVLVYQSASDGDHYFLYEPDLVHFRAVGTMGRLPTHPQPVHLSQITGINDRGEIAGYVENVAGVRGVPTMGPPGDITAPAAPAMYTALTCPGKPFYRTGGINSRGDVAGTCDNGKTVFIASAAGAVTTSASPDPRLPLMTGLGINDADDVVAFDNVNRRITGFLYRNGQFATFPGLSVYAVNNRSQIVGRFQVGSTGSAGFITRLEP